MKKPSFAIPVIFAISVSANLNAQERLQMEGIEIIGNRELPRVLYIVPWKAAERFEIESPPVASIMEQKLTRLERPSFKRKIHYHEAIYGKQNPAN